MSDDQVKFCRKKIDSLLRDECIIELPKVDRTGFVNNVFLVEKQGSQGYWQILNAKFLNQFLSVQRFKTESIKDVQRLLDKDFYVIHLDLEQAYHQILLRPGLENFFQFKFENRILAYRTMVQG